jgi:predicted XRE-type DNA-binding protein
VEKLKRHWTERSTAAFIHRISFDFVTQLMKRMDQVPINQTELAKRLHVTRSAVSQFLNKPGNLQLVNAVEYAKGLGLKVALVAYDDGDPRNLRGPISSEIFEQCWKLQGAPVDYFELGSALLPTCRMSLWYDTAVTTNEPYTPLHIDAQLELTSSNDKKSVVYRA